MSSLLLALARRWTFLGRVLVRLMTKQESPDREGRSDQARARFWTELRQGQREAKAQAASRIPDQERHVDATAAQGKSPS